MSDNNNQADRVVCAVAQAILGSLLALMMISMPAMQVTPIAWRVLGVVPNRLFGTVGASNSLADAVAAMGGAEWAGIALAYAVTIAFVGLIMAAVIFSDEPDRPPRL